MAENEQFEPVRPFFQKQMNPVNICFAVNEHYALPLRNVIYSLIKFADSTRCYDILVMTKGLSEKTMKLITGPAENKDYVSVRFIEMAAYENEYLAKVIPKQKYLTVETDYRLFMSTELFSGYERMLYLDCDTLVLADISKLFDEDLEGKVLGAVVEYSFRFWDYCKNPLFIDNEPYSIRSYCKNIVGVPSLEDYFNAGVLLIDTEQLRKITSISEMVEVLSQKHFFMNDQDVINHLVSGNFKHLDVGWNYLICYEYIKNYPNSELQTIFSDVYCDTPGIVHYVGAAKPWKDSKVTMKALYDKVVSEIDG